MSFFLSVLVYILFFPGALLMLLSWPNGTGLSLRRALPLELLLGCAMVFAAGFVLAAAVFGAIR